MSSIRQRCGETVIRSPVQLRVTIRQHTTVNVMYGCPDPSSAEKVRSHLFTPTEVFTPSRPESSRLLVSDYSRSPGFTPEDVCVSLLTSGLRVLRQLRKLAKKLYWSSPAGVPKETRSEDQGEQIHICYANYHRSISL